VIAIVAVCERDQEPGIGDAFHEREKALREEWSRGPEIAPAQRMKACPSEALALSRCSRIILL
jgi:hypothetical protein